jgi:hypothetical protein
MPDRLIWEILRCAQDDMEDAPSDARDDIRVPVKESGEGGTAA